jgi:hypothetical protein
MWFDSRHRDHQLHGPHRRLSGTRRSNASTPLPLRQMIKRTLLRDGRSNWRQGPGAEVWFGFGGPTPRTPRCAATGGADEAGRRGQRPGGTRVADRPGVAGALGASPQIDRAVPVSARTSTCVMPINGDLSTPNPVRAHIRALIRPLLNHPAGDLIQPADADLPDPKVWDRAGVPPLS